MLAAVIGLLILRQSLVPLDWLAIAVIVAANAVSVGADPARSEPEADAGGY